MQEYLLTHPSLLIITLTIITILLIYIFRNQIKRNYVKVEDTSVESTCSIEMQTMTTLPSIPCDEPDLLAPLPNPRLYKKLRDDFKKPSRKYDVPRIHGIPEAAEPNSSSESSIKNNDYTLVNNLKKQGSNLENLERKYNLIKYPAAPSSKENIENVTQPVVRRVKSNQNTDNRMSISDVYKHGSYVSFDGEFDHFDDLSRRSNVMRITMQFDPDEPPVNV